MRSPTIPIHSLFAFEFDSSAFANFPYSSCSLLDSVGINSLQTKFIADFLGQFWNLVSNEEIFAVLFHGIEFSI